MSHRAGVAFGTGCRGDREPDAKPEARGVVASAPLGTSAKSLRALLEVPNLRSAVRRDWSEDGSAQAGISDIQQQQRTNTTTTTTTTTTTIIHYTNNNNMNNKTNNNHNNNNNNTKNKKNNNNK